MRRTKKTSVHERLYKPCKSKKINVEKFEKTIFTLKKILKKEEARYNALLQKFLRQKKSRNPLVYIIVDEIKKVKGTREREGFENLGDLGEKDGQQHLLNQEERQMFVDNLLSNTNIKEFIKENLK